LELILPDTNAWVAYFAGREPVAGMITQAIRKQKIVVSVIVAAEFFIKATPRQKRRFELMIDTFGVEDITWPVAREAIKMRQTALVKSKRVYLLDCLIAATAKLKSAAILTLDKRDFVPTGVEVIEVRPHQVN